MPDWLAWHDAYDGDSALRERLAIVQSRIAEAAAERPAGQRVISICDGQARDLAGGLAGSAGAASMTGVVVELDPRNAADAAGRLADARLTGVEVVCADAAETRHYRETAPADLVLVCGVFGNITDEHVEHTVSVLPMLCAPGATVIWTRHRRPPDLTPTIRGWFERHGFEEVAFEPPDGLFSVGTSRYGGPPVPFRDDLRLFDFVGHDALRAQA